MAEILSIVFRLSLTFLAWFISEKILLDNYEGTFDTIRDSGFGIRDSEFGVRDSK